MRKILFIINPISGEAKGKLIEKEISHFLGGQTEWQIQYTEYKGHAVEIAKKAVKDQIDCVVAVGGDGTINETARCLMHTETALGIIPAGSGNGLARHLGIPLNTLKALERVVKGQVISIDTCQVNDEYFFCTSGVGFDALVSHKFATAKKRGFRSYVRISWKEFFNYQPDTYQIEIDGQIFKEKAFVVALANAAQFGNNAFIAPKADITDGLLDVCMLLDSPKWKLVVASVLLFTRRLDRYKQMKIVRGKDIIIQKISANTDKQIMHIDGEAKQLSSPLRYTIHQQTLKIVI